MAFNMAYASEVLYNVTDVLFRIKERGGKVPGSFVLSEANRLQGQWASDVLNIALAAMDRGPAFSDGKATPAQMDVLVARAKQENKGLLVQIAALRAARAK